MDDRNDLTKGSARRGLLRFFFPMLFTNLLQQIYSVADTAIVGKGLGDAALGGVGNLSSLSLLIIGFSMGMTNGFSVITAQKYGEGDSAAVKRAVICSVKLSAILSALLTAAGCLLLRPVLFAMNTDEAILSDSLTYGYIIFGGVTVTVAYNLCSGLLRSFGDSRTPFASIMISSAVNIVLDLLLIFVFHTGVGGAAAATVLSQGLSVFLCFMKIKNMPVLHGENAKNGDDTETYLLLLKNGIPAALMNSVTAVGCMVVQGFVNDRGAQYTSAYSVCSKYLNLFMLPSITAGFAVSSFVSQNFGAGEIGRIKQGVRVCAGIAGVSYILMGAVMILFPRVLAGAMLNSPETISLAASYFRICGIELILVNLLFIFRNAVQGMGYPFIPMLSGLLEMLLRIPAIILLLPLVGFSATAYAEGIAWTGALSLNLAAYIICIRRHENKSSQSSP